MLMGELAHDMTRVEETDTVGELGEVECDAVILGASKGAGTIRGVAFCTSGMPDGGITYSGWSSGSAVANWHPITGSNPIGSNPLLSAPSSTPKELKLSVPRQALC